MRTGLPEPDSLLEQLETVNDRLLSFNASDLAQIGETIELRAHLAAQAGRFLRSSANASVLQVYREGLEQAVDAGDIAVQRLLSLRQTINSSNDRMNRLQSAQNPGGESSLSCDM